MTRFDLLALLALVSLVATGCPTGGGDDDDSSGDDDDSTEPLDFAISSPDMVEPYFDVPANRECEQALPVAFSCNNSNPEIRWEGVPEGTVSLALIFDDPTAGGFDHWAIFNIDPSETGLDAGISGRDVNNNPPGDAVELENGFGWDGYLGSCPSGVNLYSWRLYALDDELDAGITTYGALQVAAEDAQIQRAEMCHVFDGSQI